MAHSSTGESLVETNRAMQVKAIQTPPMEGAMLECQGLAWIRAAATQTLASTGWMHACIRILPPWCACRYETKVIARVQDRVALFTRMPVLHQEDMQVGSLV